MAAYLKTVCTFPHNTGLPEDSVVNTWHWISTHAGGRESSADIIKAGLDTFYAAIKSLLSSQYAWNNGTYEHLDLGDARPRVPFQTDSVALGTLSSTTNDLPAEVAICVSMRGATGSGLNMRRRRGRVYIGPLQLTGADQPIMATGSVDLVATSAAALMTLTETALAVHSPYTFHGVPVGGKIADYPDEVPAALDDSFVEVASIWVDNAWDTQRRRGPKATYRKTV